MYATIHGPSSFLRCVSWGWTTQTIYVAAVELAPFPKEGVERARSVVFITLYTCFRRWVHHDRCLLQRKLRGGCTCKPRGSQRTFDLRGVGCVRPLLPVPRTYPPPPPPTEAENDPAHTLVHTLAFLLHAPHHVHAPLGLFVFCFARLGGRAALTFRIGPDFDSARDFVYKLGPQRLDELLSAKVVSEF